MDRFRDGICLRSIILFHSVEETCPAEQFQWCIHLTYIVSVMTIKRFANKMMQKPVIPFYVMLTQLMKLYTCNAKYRYNRLAFPWPFIRDIHIWWYIKYIGSVRIHTYHIQKLCLLWCRQKKKPVPLFINELVHYKY